MSDYSYDPMDIAIYFQKAEGSSISNVTGWEASDGELGLVLGQIRRILSLTFVKAQALCLRARLANLGDGARAAAERRQQAGREEEWRRREALAHFHAHIRGRGVARAGEVFVRA